MQLIELERSLFDPSVRSDTTRLGTLLHDEFTECGRSGNVYNRSEIMASVTGEVMDFTIWSQGFRIIPLSETTALLTYFSAREDQHGELSMHAFRSSLWLQTPQGWKLRFHQATAIGAFPRGAQLA